MLSPSIFLAPAVLHLPNQGRYLIAVAGCIFDPAQPDQLKSSLKRGKKGGGNEGERGGERGGGYLDVCTVLISLASLLVISAFSRSTWPHSLLGPILCLALLQIIATRSSEGILSVTDPSVPYLAHDSTFHSLPTCISKPNTPRTLLLKQF